MNPRQRILRSVQITTGVVTLGLWGASTWVMGSVWLGVPTLSAFPAAFLALLCYATWTATLLVDLAFFALGHASIVAPELIPGRKLEGPRRLLPDRPRVAILYTTADDFSEKAVESLEVQTYERARVFILDDGRAESTRQRVDSFARSHRVEVVRRSRHRGYKAGNLNDCLEKIGYDFDLFAVFDGDNVAMPDLVELCVQRFRDPRVGFVISRKHPFDDQGSGLPRHLGSVTSVWYEGSLRTQQNLGMVIFDGHGGMIRVDAWRAAGGFPITSTEDIALAVRIRTLGWYGVYEDRAICYEEFPQTIAHLHKRNEKWLRGLLHSMALYLGGFLRSRRVAWVEKLDLIRIVVSHVSPMLALGTVTFTTLLARADPSLGNRMWDSGAALLLLVLLYAGLLPLFGTLWRRPATLVDTLLWANLTFLGAALRNTLDVVAYAVSRSSVFGVTAVDRAVELDGPERAGHWWASPKNADSSVALISAGGGALMLAAGIEMQSIWLIPFGIAALSCELLRVHFMAWFGRVAGAACLSLVVFVTLELYRAAQ